MDKAELAKALVELIQPETSPAAARDPHDPLFLQEIRKAHCSASATAEHPCVGTCSITPDGMTLSCKLCDSEDIPLRPGASIARQRVQTLLEILGLEWDAIAGERQVLLVQEFQRDHCPGCGHRRTIPGGNYNEHYECRCLEWRWTNHRYPSGWERKVPLKEP